MFDGIDRRAMTSLLLLPSLEMTFLSLLAVLSLKQLELSFVNVCGLLGLPWL